MANSSEVVYLPIPRLRIKVMNSLFGTSEGLPIQSSEHGLVAGYGAPDRNQTPSKHLAGFPHPRWAAKKGDCPKQVQTVNHQWFF